MKHLLPTLEEEVQNNHYWLNIVMDKELNVQDG